MDVEQSQNLIFILLIVLFGTTKVHTKIWCVVQISFYDLNLKILLSF